MANAPTAIQNGFNYQARVFWLHAFDLLIPEKRVHEVHFEAGDPKAFDDVVVHYEAPVPRGGTTRIDRECHQVKWHVHAGGRFGYADLIDPAFIGATRTSLLERLRDARKSDCGSSAYVLVTTDRIRDDDQLAEIHSKNDQSILIERLFSSKTDNSRMGEVRRCWREHLGLASDEQLKPILSSFRLVDGYRSLEQLRAEVNDKAVAVGLKPIDDVQSDFRYDGLAQQLASRRITRFTRSGTERIMKDEGLWTGREERSELLPVAIHSFLGLATDLIPTEPENTLFLTHYFRRRYLAQDRDWRRDVAPEVKAFLAQLAARSRSLRLVMNAHASIAYLSGSVLHVKSGINVELAQKGVVGGLRIWRADDGSVGASLVESCERVGDGPDTVAAVSLNHDVSPDVAQYCQTSLPTAHEILSFVPPDGPGQRTVAGGEHAAALAEQVARRIRAAKSSRDSRTVHLFAACPNSFLFYLGQLNQGIGPVVVYEYDFDGQGHRGYQPSFTID